MFSHDVNIRVRYAETDKMGYVYYGNYATYLEVARVETFRHLGLSYKKMEDAGVMMPVLEYKTKYIRPARYDDLLTIKVSIKKKPEARIIFEYEIFNEEGVLLNIAETTLVFVSSETGRPCYPPEDFSQKIAPFFDEKQT
ncbi:thioesterase family protein [Cytophagaceae bacterium ABcell3]|nr:thioesterase family protein [Cytophagaceae bacterium ABcell3]